MTQPGYHQQRQRQYRSRRPRALRPDPLGGGVWQDSVSEGDAQGLPASGQCGPPPPGVLPEANSPGGRGRALQNGSTAPGKLRQGRLSGFGCLNRPSHCLQQVWSQLVGCTR